MLAELRQLRDRIDAVLLELERLAPALAAWTASGPLPLSAGAPQERVGSLPGIESCPHQIRDA